jgi:hypothetical protein
VEINDEQDPDDTFAPIASGSWKRLVEGFFEGIEECKRAAVELKDTISGTRDGTNVEYDLAETALHNAITHACGAGTRLGQIVLLRRMQGLWPPAGGDPNDI